VTVLTAFSDIASLAFDTARLLTDSIEKQKFDGELRAARSMQQSLLPANVPKIPEFEIEALSIPAYEVGGDYYDFSTLWNGKHLIITGDVSGKGISASIFMAEVKGIVQALAPTMSSIRELLVASNDAVMRNIRKNATSRSFVTLAAIALEGPKVHYARAGHTPLLYFGANGDFRYLQPKGMGIGFVGRKLFESVLEEEEFILGKGETLVLFSDGITEVRDANGEELGYQRFAEIIRAARFEDDVEKMKDRILKNVLDYSATTSFSDDATFVIIRRL
jgi:serine phosphatase RsbU (regulator of sigma subunit)